MSANESKKLARREVLVALGAKRGRGGTRRVRIFVPTSPSTATTTTTTTTNNASCVVSASETRGPYPDTIGMINNAAFYRRDITEGRSGLPLTLALTIVNVNNACAAVSGVQVEVWQCDRRRHLLRVRTGLGQTFLRGVQTTDAGGQVTFTTIIRLVRRTRDAYPCRRVPQRRDREDDADRVSGRCDARGVRERRLRVEGTETRRPTPATWCSRTAPPASSRASRERDERLHGDAAGRHRDMSRLNIGADVRLLCSCAFRASDKMFKRLFGRSNAGAASVRMRTWTSRRTSTPSSPGPGSRPAAKGSGRPVRRQPRDHCPHPGGC